MIFNFEEKPATRFEMNDGEWVELRTLSIEDWRKIQKATISYKPFAHMEEGPNNIKTWKVLNQEVINIDIQMEMTNDLSITAWGGFKDREGIEIPCNKEMKNKLMMMKDDARFRDFITEKMRILSDLENKKKEEVEKNGLNG